MQIHGGQAGGPWWCEMFRSWFLSTACLKLRMWAIDCDASTASTTTGYNSSLLIQFPCSFLAFIMPDFFATGKKTWRKWHGNDVEDIDVWNTSPGWRPCCGLEAFVRWKLRWAKRWPSCRHRQSCGLLRFRVVCRKKSHVTMCYWCYSTCVLKNEVEKLEIGLLVWGNPQHQNGRISTKRVDFSASRVG